MPEINKLLKNKFGVARTTKESVVQSKSPVDKVVKQTIKKEPIKKLSEVEQYKKELSMIQKKAGILKATEDELYRIEEERQHKEKVDFVNKTLASPFTGNKEVDMQPSLDYAIEELLPKAQIPDVIEYPEPFQEEPALNRELAEFKRKINQHLHQVGFSNPGGGGIGDIGDAGDIDTGTAKIDGKFLKFDASSGKFVGADAGGSNPAADDIAAGDGAVSIVTTSGNITIDAQAGDADIIFKGTDNTSDITALTLDMSDAGKAIFNGAISATTITLSADGGVIVPDDGNIGSASSTAAMQISSGGIVTFADDIIIKDAGTIGSASDADAISIASDGVVTMNQIPVFSAGINVSGGTIAGTLATAAQTNITSLGTLTTLTVDNIIINGTNIGHTSDTDSIAIASDGVVTFSQIPVLPANSIDSDYYVDGSIDTAHIADNQITLAKMAGIARGKIIVGDASGDPAVLAPGTNGQVLTSDGTDLSFTDISVSSLAADNLSAGDAAVTIATTSGNITIDAQAGDADIIFKGTDSSSDITALTLDMSDAGTAIFNSVVKSSTYFWMNTDNGVGLRFGINAEIKVTHVHDVGLTVTNTIADTDNRPIVLQLKSEEDAIVADDVIASIEMAAGDSDGTDGATVAAGIHAIAEDTFSGSSNLTKLVFTTGVSETAASSATAKMTLSSAGLLTIADDFMIKDGGTIGVASTNDAMTISSAGIVTFKDDIIIKDGGTIGSASDTDAITISSGGVVTMDQIPVFSAGINVSGGTIAGTLATAAQTNITSLGTLTTLTVDNIIINGTNIGHTSDTDAIAIGSGGVVNFTQTPTVASAAVKSAGKESIFIPAAAMYPSTTNGCAALAQVETTALRPDLKCLDFDASSDEFAQFAVSFPKSWNEGTVTFQPFWTVTGTNTGTVAWQLGGIAVSSDDSINTAFGTLVATTALAHSGTSNDLMVSAESGTVTIAGSPAAADQCFFQINRDVSADDQTGDARLLGIKLFFTTDAGNDA
jgi:hypothetical protein